MIAPRPVQRSSRLSAVQQEDAPTTTSVAGAAATPPAAGAGERYFSLLPPFLSRTTRLEELGPGLWGLVQPLKLDFQAFDIQLRMTVARLPDGSLMLISPLAPTDELLGHLSALGGRVSHIVLPSSSPEHWFYGPALSDRFPDATVWVVPGLLEGKGLPFPFFNTYTKGMRPRCKTLGADPLPPELEGQLDWEVLRAPFFIEAAVVLPQHSALLLADTGFCMAASEYAHLGQGNIDAAKKVGVWDRLGPITRVVFDKYPKEGRAWVEAVQRRDWEKVVPAHASVTPQLLRDGRAAFAACFAFLYE